MNAKLKLYLTYFQFITNIVPQDFYFAIKCQITNKVYKSPIINKGQPTFNTNTNYFWQVDLYPNQQNILLKMIQVNQNTKNLNLISQVTLNKQPNIKKQKKIVLCNNRQKIAILKYQMYNESLIKGKINKTIFDSESQRQENENKHIFKSKSKQLLMQHDSEDQRYDVHQTPHSSKNNSMIKLINYNDHSQLNFINGLQDQSFLQREPYHLDQSMVMSKQVHGSKSNKKYQPSSLQKWMKKLQQVEKNKQKQNENTQQFECKIPQKYKNKHTQPDATKLNLKTLSFDTSIDQNFTMKSLKLNVVDDNYDDEQNQSLFQCSFSLIDNENGQNYYRKINQLKLKNLLTEIPSDKNIQISLLLENEEQNENEIQISGIFMKDKCLSSDKIPLFGPDQKIFGSLSYSAKKIQNVSVQCLPSLQQHFNEQIKQEQQEQPFDFKSGLKIRKLNKLLRRQIATDFSRKKSSFQDKEQEPTLNSNKITSFRGQNQEAFNDQTFSKLSTNRKDSFLSSNLKRSNTEDNVFSSLQNEVQEKNQSPQSINRLKQRIVKLNQKTSKFTINPVLSQSPTKKFNRNRLRFRSTDLADLRQEQSQDQQQHLKSDTYKKLKRSQKFSTGSQMNSPKRHIKLKKISTQPDINDPIRIETILLPRKPLSEFIIQINSITLILYHHQKPEEQQSGKFVILKSDQGQTFITQTLFTNYLNLNWKNKFYQFTGSQIQLSLYERTGYSSQCQNKFLGKVSLKLVQLMKAIKQNFYREQIYLKGKAIGTIILIYDVFIENNQTYQQKKQKRSNTSQIRVKNTIKKKDQINEFEYVKINLGKESQKSTIKIENKQKNRKRARTLQTSHKLMLPSIDRFLSPSRRKPYYQGGKNIKIGRAQRFLNTNIAELVGQM